MKVIHIITTINLGGAENHLFDLVKEQRSVGKEVAVAYLKGDHYWKEKYESLGVQVYFLNVPNSRIPFSGDVLRNVIRTFNPNIVHAHMPPAELLTRLALFGLGPKYKLIISKHNDERFAEVPFQQAIAKWVSKRAHALICISNAVKKYMGETAGLNKSKLNLVYYAVDVERFSNAKAAKDLADSNIFTIGTIARLVPQKSLHTLIEAFAKFKNERPLSRLVIVGAGPLEQELRGISKSFNVERDIVWTGKRSDVPSVLKTFNIFALTSIYEGFGLVLLEAMAAQVPVVASNVSAIPEVLDYGKAGRLFEVGNVGELTACFSSLASAEEARKISDQAFKRVHEDFSLSRMERETSNIYEAALKSN